MNRPRSVADIWDRGRNLSKNIKRRESSIKEETTTVNRDSSSPSNLPGSYCLQARKIEQLETEKLQLVAEKQKLEEVNQWIVSEKNDIQAELYLKDKEYQDLFDKFNILELEHKELQKILENKQHTGKISSLVAKLHVKFLTRPSKETLKQKNIIKDELCFDSYLHKIPRHEFLTDIPKVLVECVQLLEGTPEYLDTHGLYRISANYAVVQKLRFKIDADKYKVLRDQRDPHTFTGIIKLFLRELKEPLISYNALESVVGSLDYRTVPDQIAIIQQLISTLDDINRSTLKYLIEHLQRVADNAANEIDSKGLAIVMSPCIFHDVFSAKSLEINMNQCALPNVCLKFIIDNCAEIFYRPIVTSV